MSQELNVFHRATFLWKAYICYMSIGQSPTNLVAKQPTIARHVLVINHTLRLKVWPRNNYPLHYITARLALDTTMCNEDLQYNQHKADHGDSGCWWERIQKSHKPDIQVKRALSATRVMAWCHTLHAVCPCLPYTVFHFVFFLPQTPRSINKGKIWSV